MEAIRHAKQNVDMPGLCHVIPYGHKKLPHWHDNLSQKNSAPINILHKQQDKILARRLLLKIPRKPSNNIYGRRK
jgi:hypothetical protein